MFASHDRFRVLAGTGVFGRPNANGQPDISVDQFVEACVNGWLTCYVASQADGAATTLVYGVPVDSQRG